MTVPAGSELHDRDRVHVSVLHVGWGWTAAQLQEGWRRVEELGFDACYLGDDLFPHPNVDLDVYDPWTLLPAMAVTTDRMLIGSMVSPVGRRHPALFAKITSGVDQLSGGRLVVGLGAGNMPEQQASAGLPFLSPAQRCRMLEEEAAALRSLWTERRTTLDGDHYRLLDAINQPKPLQRPGPEILMGVGSARHLGPVAGALADRVNVFGSDDDKVMAAIGEVRRQATSCGRDANQLLFSRLGVVMLTDRPVAPADRSTVVAERAARLGLDVDEVLYEFDEWCLSYVGPASGCAAALAARTVARGINEIVITMDSIAETPFEWQMDQLERFATEVVPELRALSTVSIRS